MRKKQTDQVTEAYAFSKLWDELIPSMGAYEHLETITEKAMCFSMALLKHGRCKEFPFHNWVHTNEVVRNVKTILRQQHIPESEAEPLIIAAWMHDIGFVVTYQQHEVVSCQLAERFLVLFDYPTHKLELVLTCIRATQIPQKPEHPLAEILCDADLFHLGTADFTHRNALLRQEWEKELGKSFSEDEWQELNLIFLQQHQYFTAYGKDCLQEGKQQNIYKLSNLNHQR
ncbi:HD domain-containing protein [Limibacter armeniacum]|uniref:HD domain-containing protein n=1 Tax=Limibacter armeniacum TaxID=466084 RepID=UPI002FE6979A